jgi:HK97 family phage major capsid protein
VSAGWVGEGLSKPVGKLDFDRLSVPWAKVAVIAVITQELARLSDPSAEMLVRDDLVNAIVAYLDQQFVDPAVAASAGVRPGSITNGVTAIPSSGPTVANVNADLTAALKVMASANMPMTSPHWLMTPGAFITINGLRTTQEIQAFPETNQGMLKGYPVIQSNNIATVDATPDTTNIIFGDFAQVLHAEDPAIDLTSSTEASLQMDTAPATPPTPLVSMFQQNMLAIKAEQYQYWVKRYANAITYISGFQV